MTNAIVRTIDPRAKDLGGGFRVRRVLPFHAQKMVGPFIFFDHFGPVDYAPGEGLDVRPHPHIGLSTVTYLFEGAIRHQDSLGTDIVIRPGAVNWMTAGHGIVHSERTPAPERANGQRMHGLQTWVALPITDEDCAPAFSHHAADTLPTFQQNGADIRVLAGEAWGHASPVTFPWDILYVAIEAAEGTNMILPANLAEERALYIVTGSARIDDETAEEGHMLVIAPGEDVAVEFLPGTKAVICGGATMDGSRKIEWNFVASDTDKIEKAKQDWEESTRSHGTSRFPLVPGDDAEWIPLP
ncbi:MAG: pirin family protein [Alphaproteobacteria bacterium]|nr:pirin family protein [Alphaproteobacteria bacterium]MBU2083230.1 pirin family protein [Alphaproteobacteria bacterium]MBU2144471.1 pirin family protein [Alphaproteobacteria bacterium]MBU2195514.1 pirin family protein [Alphaproteobacteria bacterium]